MGCATHEGHEHAHGPGCGHEAVMHDGHVDYLHDGHLHHPHGDHYDEHAVAVSAENPTGCDEIAEDHHAHGPACGHPQVPHGDHVDYLVEGRLHHPHSGHCDDHGALPAAA